MNTLYIGCQNRVYSAFLMLLLVIGIASNQALAVEETSSDESTSVVVNLFNALDESPLAGQRVDLYKLEGGSRSWAGRAYTNDLGQAEFEAPGLGSGTTYQFRARPYQGIYVYSSPVDSAEPFSFTVGTLPVTLFDPILEQSIVGKKIYLYERTVEDGYRYVGGGYTDDMGTVRFSPTSLGNGAKYFLRSRPHNGGYAYSSDISEIGAFTFNVGTLPITVKNPLEETLVIGTRIYLYENLADGTSKYRSSGYTDENGTVKFSPQGLGGGRNYYAKTRPYNTGYAYSDEITSTGPHQLNVGTVPITVHDVEGGNNLAGLRVYLYERMSDGKSSYRASGYTDENGTVKFSPSGVGSERIYFAKTRPFGSSYAYSKDIDLVGPVQLDVGTLALTLVNPIDESSPVGTKVYLYQKMEDGSSKYRARGYTDENGQVKFTPYGLGDGSSFYAKARPYNAGYAYSDNFDAIGSFNFAVGTLSLTLINPLTTETLSAVKVHLYERLADGSSKWNSYGYTNEDGIIHFTPRGLGSGAKFYAKARPYNAGYAYSTEASSIGAFNFEVGMLPVMLSNLLEDSTLVGQRLYLYEVLEDGSSKYRDYGYTNADGKVIFSPGGLGEGKEYYVKARPYNRGYAYSDSITTRGLFTFNVGTLPVVVSNPLDGTIFSGLKVYLYERTSEGETKYRSYGYTDDEGRIRFTPKNLGNGATFFVKAKPYKTGYAYSSNITEIGAYAFDVGTLRIKLFDFASSEPITDSRVYLYERVSDESSEYRGYGYTDENGLIHFTPSGLDDDRSYFAKARPFNTGYAYSDEITENGDFDFPVGTLNLTVVSNIDGSALGDKKVYLYERVDDETADYAAYGYTDDDGQIRFSPSGLGSGRNYFAKAKSPINSQYRESDPYTEKGSFTFQVGNSPLVVSLVNAISGDALVDKKIYVYELLGDDERSYRYRAYTNDDGVALFDLDGLDEDRKFVLSTTPYNAGRVYSPEIVNSGEFRWEVGTTPVTLVDGDSNTILLGKKIYAYEKLPNGELKWTKYGYTNLAGIVHFDLDFSNTNPYVFYSKNLFGGNKRYYSPLTFEPGAVSFIVTRDGDNTLDLTPPAIAITSPVDAANVTENGFTVQGLATDNRSIDSVVVNVLNGAVSTDIVAIVDTLTSSWSAVVADALFNDGDTLVITATATDLARNSSAASVNVSVVADNEGPVVSVTSHVANDNVPETGFLLAGNANDLTGIASMTATISDVNDAGIAPIGHAVSVAGNGNWTLRIDNADVIQGQTIQIDLDALDSNGNPGSTLIVLNVVTVDFAGLQLINRITFGATPALLTEVETIGADNFITQQLNPAALDDTELQTRLQFVFPGGLPTTSAELQRWALLHKIYSPRQLQEVMTWFWDNHFNTDINTTRTDYLGNSVRNSAAFELAENQAFRNQALGNFRTLLDINAKSPTMLIYLDNISNVVGDSNENYAREVMELSTLGVDGGYTETDVESAAELLTGGHLDATSNFFMNSAFHNTATQTLFQGTPQEVTIVFDGSDIDSQTGLMVGAGINQFNGLLDALASHPSTANHICTKLVTYFVNDTPPASAVASCSATFLSSSAAPDQITQVLTTILSNEFFDSANYRAKIKTPVEFIASAVRGLQAETDGNDLLGPLTAMGVRLFQNPVPTGYSEIGSDWINSSLLIERIKWVNDLARNAPGGTASSIIPIAFFSPDYLTNDGIVGYLLQVSTGDPAAHDATGTTSLQALSVFGSYRMDLSNAANAAFDDPLLRQLIGTSLSFPQFQFQ